jgi:hypothetical protein
MTRNMVLALAIVLYGASAIVHRASAITLTPELLAGCCENLDGTGSSGFDNTGTNNIGIGNTGNNNIGFGNNGNHNIGVENGSAGNLGAFNGRGNTSPTSGNSNIGVGNGNGNTSVESGNGNVGVGNGNGNESSHSGNGNVGAFNGNFNGIDNAGSETTYNGNNNVGAFNGNLNGVGNVGDGNGSYNGNNNVGIFNGNQNGNGNVGSDNGNGNGNGNVGAFNGNLNGAGNIGSASGNANGNNNTGTDNGNQNGNANIGAFNGNWNGNDNVGTDNGNQNGNGNVGAFNGNWNGNGNVNFNGRGPAAADLSEGGDVLQKASLTVLTTLSPNPTASDGEAVGFGKFENAYDFTLNEASDVQFGAIALGIFNFDMDLCATAMCLGSDIIDSGHVVHGLLSIAGGWVSDLGPGTYYLLVSGFGARGGGAYLAGLIATPVATTPIPASVLMLLTGLAALACCCRYRPLGSRTRLPERGA